MYSVNRKCSSALKLMHQNVVALNSKSTTSNVQEINAFIFNRAQFKQSSYQYSSQASTPIKPIRKLMVANRGWISFQIFLNESINTTLPWLIQILR
jgi:hypothetical protein